MRQKYPTPSSRHPTKTEQRTARREQRALFEARKHHQLQRLRLMRWVGLPLLAVVIVTLVSWAMITNQRSGAATSAASVENRPLPAPGVLPGLQETLVPWQPEYDHLVERYRELNFPPNGDESYHIHALLHVYVQGQSVTVPANIGISAVDQLESPLHTHDTSGIIHIEAGQPFPFRLADIFAVWGVVFTDHQLVGYKNLGQKTVHVFVNGEHLVDPTHYEIRPHDNIVVAYGRPGSFPIQPPTDALQGL
ncbi:MAG: hypothetical protein NVSMB52_11720 [Chloroflexota bacterium]